MQLAGKKSLLGALSLATSTLLGSGTSAAAAQTELESTALLYKETGRITVVTALFGIKTEIREKQFLSLNMIYDGMTGASPNGAAAAKKVQSFTRPSGLSFYKVQPGKIPLDDSFTDKRAAMDVSYSRPAGQLSDFSFGLHLSNENDYTSQSLNTSLTRDFNHRNTTLSLSGSVSRDVVRPIGGLPLPFAFMVVSGIQSRYGQNADKKVYDLLAGVTQVIDRETLVRLNYSFGRATGYLNEPYKLISIVEGESSDSPGEPFNYIYEGRPSSRNKHALFGQIRRYLRGNSLDFSYRYFRDNWRIHSQMADLFYLWNLPKGRSLEPHIRWYKQSAAYFYRYSIIRASEQPTYASADFRLAPFSALTFGLQYGFTVRNRHKLKITAEYYSQFGDRSPPGTLQAPLDRSLLPEVSAFMIRIGYTSGS